MTYVMPFVARRMITFKLEVTNSWNFIYWIVVGGVTIQETDPGFTYIGSWSNHPGGWAESQVALSTAEFTFDSSLTFELHSDLQTFGGTGKVYLDNVFQQNVDYNGTDTDVIMFSYP